MIHYSIIMPQRDAADAVERRLAELCSVLTSLGKPHEIICVDDGSSVANRNQLKELLAAWPGLRLVFLDRPAGIDAALSAGIAAARGETVIVVESGDRYPVAELSKLVRRLSRADAVFGCRRLSAVRRTWRRIAQLPRRLMFGGAVRDPDCLFWAARHEAVAGLTLARGMHRYLPGMITRRGFRVGEIHVDHRPAARRATGRDVWPNPGDLLAAWWLRRRQAPYSAEEVCISTKDATSGKQVRIDPPQPLPRGATSQPDTRRDDRHNAAS